MPVAWQTIWLRQPQRLAFSNGEPLVAAVESHDWDDLAIEFAGGSRLVLHGAIDADERFEWPRIHLFVGRDPAELFFFGGPSAYRVRSEGRIVETLQTHRSLADYECGTFDVVTEQDVAVIVYEVGILVIGDDLRPRWLRRKYMGPHRIVVADGRVWLYEPHMIPICHRLSDGELVMAPPGYSPGVPYDHVPDEREIFEGCVNTWDREAVISALQAIASELVTLAEGSVENDTLRTTIVTAIERMTADRSARPPVGFGADIATRWCALGVDTKQLLRVAVAGVYALKRPCGAPPR